MSEWDAVVLALWGLIYADHDPLCEDRWCLVHNNVWWQCECCYKSKTYVTKDAAIRHIRREIDGY